MKVCVTCRWEKSRRQFYKGSTADGLDSYCKKCRTEKNNISNPRREPTWLMLAAARGRAKKQEVPFDLSVDDIVIPSHCPILGLRLVKGEGKPTPCSPSLDKIIPALGYVRGNIAVISNRANTIKNNASVEELRAIVRFLEDHHGDT